MSPRDFVKHCLYRAGVTRPARDDAAAPRAWILSYHSVGVPDGAGGRYASPAVTVAPAAFECHVAYLARHFRIVSMDGIADWLAGRLRPGRPVVAITFDDGYRDNYQYAFPILRRYRVPATFYVVTDAIGNTRPLWTVELRELVHRARRRGVTAARLLDRPVDLGSEQAAEQTLRALTRTLRSLDRKTREEALAGLRGDLLAQDDGRRPAVMMSWDELREIRRAGMVIGSHTMTHPALPDIPPDEAALEIAGSKARLEAELGGRVAHFAYPDPGGHVQVSEALRALVRDAGYLTARTSRKGVVRPDADRFALHGFSVGARSSHPALLAWMLSDGVHRLRRLLGRQGPPRSTDDAEDATTDRVPAGGETQYSHWPA
jgi:peptidoglycan/xylan/chitin deacetylase (PgdA/CDA1 family)